MGTLNDFLRVCIGIGMLGLGALLELGHRWRVVRFLTIQRRLRRRYEIRSNAPILPHGEKLAALIEQAAAARRLPCEYAATSGSTSHPKHILYPPSRIRSVKWTFSEVYFHWLAECSMNSPKIPAGLSTSRRTCGLYRTFEVEQDVLDGRERSLRASPLPNRRRLRLQRARRGLAKSSSRACQDLLDGRERSLRASPLPNRRRLRLQRARRGLAGSPLPAPERAHLWLTVFSTVRREFSELLSESFNGRLAFAAQG